MRRPALATWRRFRAVLLATALLGLAGGRVPAAAAPRLDTRTTVLPARELETLFVPALRAPRDSVAVAGALGRLVAQLQSRGWLDAHAAADWDTAGDGTLRVTIAEGPRYRLASLTIDAPSSADSARFGGALTLTKGGWLDPAAIGAALERAVRAAESDGYAYAQLGVSAWDATRDSTGAGAVRIRLSGVLGERVTVSAVRIEGLKITRREVAEKAMGRLTGLPYNPAAALAAEGRLRQLGLFRRVEYAGLEGEGSWNRGRLVYRVEEPHYNQFEGAVGVQGDAGTAGLVNLELGNLVGTGRAVGLHWESRGKGLADFRARYAEPLVFGTPLRLELQVRQQVQDTIYTRTDWGVRGRYALTGQEQLEAGFEEERVVQAQGEVQEADLENTMLAVERDARDDLLGPRRGTRLRLAASQSWKRETLRPTGTRTARASAVEGQSEWHRPLRGAGGVALELSGAMRLSSQRVLPVFERYPVGGAATLRGHDEEEFRVDRFALSRLEYRWFLGAGAQRVALFWDHAWMATREDVAATALMPAGDRMITRHADGIGFGLRLEAAGGLIGVDYGLAPGRAPLEGKIHLRLVTAF